MTTLIHSPLHHEHEELSATFTAFGPWLMPLKYGKELEEHRAVRERVGLFDLSHMGEVFITGEDAARFLDYALVSTLSEIKIGKAKYTMIVDERGGIIDDLIVYRLGEQRFLVVPNAGNTAVVVEELTRRAEGFTIVLHDATLEVALIAVQGPNSENLLKQLAADPSEISTLSYYSATETTIARMDILIARTGYTGEDGFEIFLTPDKAHLLWPLLIDKGAQLGLLPCGLAARDSLRLEAGMPLYGHELTREKNPYDAGLGFVISSEGDFIGRDALLAAQHPTKILVGISSTGKRAARAGDRLFVGNTDIGVVTSGQPSPTLGYPIALAYIEHGYHHNKTPIEAEIRGRRYPFTTTPLPFYHRQHKH
ncbi:glycine cleavage system aminomethyltransferase GcvT [Corynebacterium sp. ES2794-CONJ1]|uniref:glycine cleavage system aminomethyltransferase GcvT n=1 Tax=unclassified Corynebacterium TaxID=2624378 RepID=UPI00216AAB17|nr:MULTISPECIES: glycine cleavage system aminomethyltransferase GcvT [unclassified Corynebacterium]MCS4490780.1 glycine cleavage system aminomethyltransferase GcvT [Corynebacterium sp. ES2775-CONJ]MCS4492418.1 glycine cleavage system aminomethyltransferase GcvT [Corynebacterium sp. ES2715-CONJ3]MCS4532667.1 glycine cleavage system aminomethyltransferase GcvT [Corynebacterium sp. ES2730-CONJ]MCU9518701.1 glycine cleavage system aminomethyltransferase GcvT [Corynebacterium sp. ES2794-CONJ1]